MMLIVLWLFLLFSAFFQNVAVAQEVVLDENVHIYEGCLPPIEKQEFYQNAAKWTGTVVLKDIKLGEEDEFHPEYYGNQNSVVELNGVQGGYLPRSVAFLGTIKLSDLTAGTKAWTMGGGFSSKASYTIAKLTGNGEYVDTKENIKHPIIINDGSGFTGNLTILGKRWFFGTTIPESGLTAGQIRVEDGQAIAFAHQTWSANGGVSFGNKVRIIGEVGDFITMPQPPSIPMVVDSQGQLVDRLLQYTNGVLQIVRAVARDKWGNYYQTAEEAIKAYTKSTVSLLMDAVIEVEKLDEGREFKVDRQGGCRFSWRDAADKFIILDEGTEMFKVVKGRPDNGLSSFQNYLFGLKSQVGAGETPDRPFLKAASSRMLNGVLKADFGCFHGASGEVITPREDTGWTPKYQIMTAPSSDAADWTPLGEPTTEATFTVELPRPTEGGSEVRYFKPRFIFE